MAMQQVCCCLSSRKDIGFDGIWKSWFRINKNTCYIMTVPFSRQVLSQLAPYIILAEKLGSMAVQLVAGGSGIKGVKIILPTKEASALADERNFHDNSPEIPLDSIQVHLTNAESSKFVSILSDAGDILVEGKVKDDIPHLTPVGQNTWRRECEYQLYECV
ncbi:unnamed protein product [Musa hybrid cultivar]